MAGGRLLAFFQNFGSGELVVILLVALVVVGPERLPALARSLGKGLHRLRTMTDGMSSQVQDIVDDPAMAPLRELGEFAARPRQKLAEYALEAEAEERFRQEQAPSPAVASTPGTVGGGSGDTGGDAGAADAVTGGATTGDTTTGGTTTGGTTTGGATTGGAGAAGAAAPDVVTGPGADVPATAPVAAPDAPLAGADRTETEAG